MYIHIRFDICYSLCHYFLFLEKINGYAPISLRLSIQTTTKFKYHKNAHINITIQYFKLKI